MHVRGEEAAIVSDPSRRVELPAIGDVGMSQPKRRASSVRNATVRNTTKTLVLGFAVVFGRLICPICSSTGYAAELSVGDLATDFTLMEFGTQEPVSLYDFDGHIVLLDFFAYWCGPCNTAASELEPQIDEYYEQSGGNPDGIPVQLVAISVANEPPENVADFVTKYGLDAVLVDESLDVFSDYSSGFVPHLVLVNGAADMNSSQWEILYSDSGYGTGDYAQLRTIIDSVERVPEPSSVILLGLGAVALISRRQDCR
jgi:thiol-disulfide isomerase/thioredoxin